MLAAQANMTLIADARIDNRPDLIGALPLEIQPLGKTTDAELILKAYETWGEHCPERLVGDFAFAIWDSRKGRLFCARDHLGVKPFYYYQSSNIFAFASEIKALWVLPEVPRKINELRIADHLAFQVEDRQITLYEHIHRLPPACILMIQNGNIEQRIYWSLNPSREIRFSREQDYVHSFKELFDEAVRCRLRAHNKKGSMLSGGLDSSSIACTARDILNCGSSKQLQTYSAIFPHLTESVLHTVDERSYIDMALEQGGFRPNFVSVGKLSPLNAQGEMFDILDEVYMAPNLYMHLALYRAANANGMRVLLDGTDGDSTVSHGYEYLSDLARQLRWLELYRQSSLIAEREGEHSSKSSIIRKHAIRQLIPEQMVNAKRYITGERQPRWLARSVLRAEFALKIDYAERMRSLIEAHQGPQSSRYQHWREIKSGSTSLSLELVDKLSSMLSIELRYPFYDSRLVEFCLALPAGLKLSNGWTRAILRQAIDGVVPEGIRWRPTKANFLPAFGLSLIEHDHKLLDHYIYLDYQVIDPYVDIAKLREAYSRFRNKPAWSALDSQMVYGAVILAMWLNWVTKDHDAV